MIMETLPRFMFWLIAAALVCFSNGQSVQLTIDSDGTITPNQKFETLCNTTFDPRAISVESLKWKCSSLSTNSDPFGNREFAQGRGVTIYNKLTIENVGCDLDNTVCDCILVSRDNVGGNNRVRNTKKTLHLKIIDLPPESLQLSSPPPAIFVDQAFDVKCSGNVSSPERLLELYLENNGLKSQLVTSPVSSLQDNDTCMFAVSTSSTYTLTRADRDSKVVCKIRDSSTMESTPLNLQYPVADVQIKLNGLVPKGDKPQTVVDGSTYTIKYVADSNPPPTYDFLFARNEKTEKLDHPKPDYISRVAKKSHAGTYSCTAQNKLSNQEKTSQTFELQVNDKPASESGTSTGAIVAAVAGAAVLCMAIAGAAVYIRRRRSQSAETTYAADYYYGGGEYDEAYETPTAAAAPRGSVVASRGKDDASAVVTVSISRSGSRIPDADSCRSKSRDAGSRRSVQR